MKKTYEIPSVEATQFMPRTVILAGSDTIHIHPDPIEEGGGGD